MKSIIKTITSLMLVALIVPNIALAFSWYNLFTWWSKKQVAQTPAVQIATTTESIIEKSKEEVKKEIEIKKPKSKSTAKPKVTSTPVVTPVVEQKAVTPTIQTPIPPPIAEAKIEKASPYLSSIQAIDAFLANPSEQNLKDYCVKAKTLPAPGEKRVMNESRTDYVTTGKNLYDANKLCLKVMEGQLSLNRRQLISWFAYSDSYLASLDNSSESDAVREFKVSFNSYWKSISIYKLIGMTYVEGKGGPVPISESVAKISSMLAKDPNGSYKNYINRPEGYFSFVFPEKILSELKAEIVRENRNE